ncbi:MAG TPA: 30S ribosome-binding factor RbfA [Holophagaceae bacterium]|nr:30S ribosome-binding factor RbfA [Holophagaceae bacterium]
MQRPERLEDQVHFLLGTLMQRELRDPDLGFVTLTAVRLSGDRGVARIYFTVLPAPGVAQADQEAKTLKALQRATGFLRTELGKRLHMKRAPELRFFQDATVGEGNKLESLFSELEKERQARPPEPDPEPDPEVGEDA